MTLAVVRALNGSLNGGNALLISAGWLLVRNEHKLTHAMCMCVAAVISLVLPVCYLVEPLPIGWDHAAEGSSVWQMLHRTMTVSHRVLAFIIVPLVAATMVPAFGADWKIHRRLSKFTTPLWLYVSITGVLASL